VNDVLKRGGLLAGLFLGAALLLTHPLAGSLGSALPGNLGDPLLNTWTLGWGAQWLGGGRHVWDAPIFHPHPDTFAYSEHLLGISLFVAPVYWLTGNAVLMYNVALLASFVLAGASMYLLVQSLTGRRDVAIVMALAFACSPIRIAQIARLQMLMTGWLPLALWGIHRYAATRRRGYLATFGVSTVLLVLSNMYMLLIGALPIGAAMIFELVRSGRGRSGTAGTSGSAGCEALERGGGWTDRLTLARGFALALVLTGFALWPVVDKYRDVQASMGFTRDPGEVVRYSATPRSYLSAFETMEWLPWVYPEKTADRALYAGGAILLLAGLAIVIAAGRRLRRLRPQARAEEQKSDEEQARADGQDRAAFRFYVLLTIASAALSFGPILRDWHGQPIGAGPYQWIQTLLPAIDGLRAPGRFGLVAAIGLGVMAGFCATWLIGSLTGARRRAVLLAAALFVVIEAWPVRFIVEPFHAAGRPEDEALYQYLGEQPAASLVELPGAPHVSKVPNGVLVYQLETLEHPHALVNGSTGFNTPLADLIEGTGSPFSDPTEVAAGVKMLRTIGVRYVAVHTADYLNPEHAGRIVDALRRAPGLVAHRTFGTNHLFELDTHGVMPPKPAPDHPRIAVAPHQLMASHGRDRTHAAVDSRLESRWTTGHRSGAAWMRIQLEDPHDVRHVRLDLGPSREAYPRDLTIVSTDHDGQERQLFAGAVLHNLAVGLVHDPLVAPIVIPLPPNSTRVLTLHVSEATRDEWSVHELALFGTPRSGE
jgi:hypothetical protein